MPSRDMIAVANATDRNALAPASRAQNPTSGSGGNAPFGYETDTQVLFIYDPNTGTYLNIPVNGLNGLTATAAQINQALAPNNAPVNQAPTVCALAYARYDFSVDGGAVGEIIPATNTIIPANAIITGCVINSTTAVTSGGAATVGIGTHAGSSATSLLAQTGKASFTLDALIAGVPVPQTAATWVKMSAAGAINVTPAVAALTAGVIEIFVDYVLAKNA